VSCSSTYSPSLAAAVDADSFVWWPTPGGDGTGCCRISCTGSAPYDATSTCTDVESDSLTFHGASSEGERPWVSEDACRALCAANATCRAYEHNINNCELHTSTIGASQAFSEQDNNPTGASCVCWLKGKATEQVSLNVSWLFERDLYTREDGFVDRLPRTLTGDEHSWVPGNVAGMGASFGLDLSPSADVRGIWLHPPTSGSSPHDTGTLRFRLTERCSRFTAIAANIASHCSGCGLTFIFGTSVAGTLATMPLVGGTLQRVDLPLSAMASDLVITVSRCHESNCAPTSDWAVLYNASLHCYPSPEEIALRRQLAQLREQFSAVLSRGPTSESTACAHFAMQDGHCELKPDDPAVALRFTAGP